MNLNTRILIGVRQQFVKKKNVLPSLVSRHHPQVATASSTGSRSFAQYGGRHTVTMIPGDGIGPEIMESIKQVFSCAGVPVDFEEVQVTSDTLTEEKLEEALIAIKRNEVAIKGNIETDLETLDFDQKSANVVIRTKLDLFANVLKVKSLDGIRTRHNNIDIRIIRENTEGEYSALEHETVPGVIESLKIVTEKNSRQIAQFAFEYAKRNNRKKVTAIHKANIMKLGDGLFLKCCHDIAKNHPEIEFDDMIVDNCNMQLVKDPSQFDVMVMPNLYGNIIGNVCCGLVGGAGVVGGANIGTKYRVFEAGTRNTGINIAGRNMANPCALLFASTLMLKYIGLPHYSSLINQAIVDTIEIDKIFTQDIGGTNTTSDVIEAVCDKVKCDSIKLRYFQANP